MLTTSFYLLKKNGACRDSYLKGARLAGSIRKYGWHTPIPLVRILDEMGLDDAVWCLRATPTEQDEERNRKAHLFACWCARNTPIGDGRTTWDLLTDERSRTVIEVAERYAIGDATDDELSAAQDAARDAQDAQDARAARDAAWAAQAAARAARAAWAAQDAAQDALATRDAVWAALDAAWAAAWDTACATRSTALAAAWDAQAHAFREIIGG